MPGVQSKWESTTPNPSFLRRGANAYVPIISKEESSNAYVPLLRKEGLGVVDNSPEQRLDYDFC